MKEIHDTHHPLGGELYYEDARSPRRNASPKIFCKDRAPKYLGYFESVLEKSGGPNVLGRKFSYVDLSLFQLDRGPALRLSQRDEAHRAQNSARGRGARPGAARPRIKAYLASPRRLPFNELGIFRHYPELDD